MCVCVLRPGEVFVVASLDSIIVDCVTKLQIVFIQYFVYC